MGMRDSVVAVITICSVILPASVWAKAAGPSPAKPAAGGGLIVRNTEEFFRSFLHMKLKIGQRSEFETEADYRKRVPPPVDPEKIVYLSAEVCCSNLLRSRYSRYSYDIDTETLTVCGGGVASLGFGKCGSSPGVPIEIKDVLVETGRYLGANAFGAQAVVTKRKFSHYILNITNIGAWLGTAFDHNERTFKMRVSLPPKQAEKLSKSLELVFGVTLCGYEASGLNASGARRPTLESPTETDWYEYWVDARLVRVLLRDKNTGRLYARQDLPRAPSVPADASAEAAHGPPPPGPPTYSSPSMLDATVEP